MSLRNCKIIFNNSLSGVYFCGQTINGTLSIEQEKFKVYKNLVYYVTGETKVRWSETEGSKENRRSVVYVGNRVHFKTDYITLFSAYPRDEDGVSIQKGIHDFHFTAQLPSNLPSSFEGIYGKTRYYVKFISKKSYSFDKTHIQPFTVVNLSNLNYNPTNFIPIKQEQQKTFSTCCFNKGKLFITVKIQQSGFVPGQQIPINCVLVNKSSIKIKSVAFYLERQTNYTVESPHTKTRTYKEKLVEYIGQGVEKQEDTVIDTLLTVPPAPPTSLINTLITFQYFIMIKAHPSGCHRTLKSKIPINIGNIPVQIGPSNVFPPTPSHVPPQVPPHAFPNAPPLEPPYAAPAVPPHASPRGYENPVPSAPFEPPPQYFDLGLPTYEESQKTVKMKEVDTDDEDHVDYAPKYPVYKFTSEKPN